MLALYSSLMRFGTPVLNTLLTHRLKKGKEDKARISERKGVPSKPRPKGYLVWVHGASVGEAQSALILIKRLSELYPDIKILMTTGTLSSANLMAQRLPDNALHQFYPLDHPDWIKTFLDHWYPDAVIWMESELWPNMLSSIKARKIPAILVNARMSEKSFKSWRFLKSLGADIPHAFSAILCQSHSDAEYYKRLEIPNVMTTGNIKYSATPLGYNKEDYTLLYNAFNNRPVWVYASTHTGEEKIACNIHIVLKKIIPDLLTIIVPRHPERREDIKKDCNDFGLNIVFRGNKKKLPEQKTDIYIADTFGELGLFYRLSPVACIGRTFSDDGGGGHNPIEAAQLGCTVLYGPKYQNLQNVFDDMSEHKAAKCVISEQELQENLFSLLTDEKLLKEKQALSLKYAREKSNIVNKTLDKIIEILQIPHINISSENTEPKKSYAS